MNDAEWTAGKAIGGSLLVGAAMAWAGSQGGTTVGSIPVFALGGLLAFVINWVGFVPAYVFQTERYFDLIGGLTYVTVVAVALALAGAPEPRTLMLGVMVIVWAVRLGGFLFARIRREGKDARFDDLKPSALRFLMTWTLQGLWVFLTLGCGLAAMTTLRPAPLGAVAWLGAGIWLVGLGIEAVADWQKTRFRADPANRDRFIQSGLWAWSRHPNYFGEITLWCGVAITAFPTLTGWQHLTLVSPVFVYVLLTRVSGIPMLEERAEQKWGDRPAYQAYTRQTSRLLPRPPRPA